ncbi:S8 family peptidase, partial [Enterococcus faecalis]
MKKRGLTYILISYIFLILGTTGYASDLSNNISFFIDNSQTTAIEEIESELSSEKVDYIQEIGLVSFKNLDDSDRKFIGKYFNVSEGKKLPDFKPEEVNSSILNINILNKDFKSFNWPYKKILSHIDPVKEQLGKDITIALIDSGIDRLHPNLQDNNLRLKNYVNDIELDEYGHGTQVAGVIDTIAPRVNLNSYKVMDGTDGNSINMLKAIVDATNDQVDIINVSLGSYKNMEIDDERF